MSLVYPPYGEVKTQEVPLDNSALAEQAKYFVKELSYKGINEQTYSLGYQQFCGQIANSLQSVLIAKVRISD